MSGPAHGLFGRGDAGSSSGGSPAGRRAGRESDTNRLQAFLAKWQHVFSSHDEDYGRTDIVKHQIPTGDAVPSRERYRPVPPTLYSEVVPCCGDAGEGDRS